MKSFWLELIWKFIIWRKIIFTPFDITFVVPNIDYNSSMILFNYLIINQYNRCNIWMYLCLHIAKQPYHIMYLRVRLQILWRFLAELAQLFRVWHCPFQITILCQVFIEVGAYEIPFRLFIPRHIFLQFGKQLVVTLISPPNHIRQEVEQKPKFRARIRFHEHNLSGIFLLVILFLCPLIQLHFRWELK